MKYIIKIIKYKINNIGYKPLCNGMSERTPKILGFTFLLCYRCTFVLVGTILSFLLILNPKITKRINYIKPVYKILILLILFLPIILDGSIQYLTNYTSTNLIRSITGFLCGIGINIIACFIMERIFKN